MREEHTQGRFLKTNLHKAQNVFENQLSLEDHNNRLKMIFDKLKKFQVILDSPEIDSPPVFSSGDVVSGKVVLELTGESKVESLKLHAEGFARVHWTESRSAGSSTAYTQNYSDEVEYLNHRESLLQTGQSVLRRGMGDWVRNPIHWPWDTFLNTRILNVYLKSHLKACDLREVMANVFLIHSAGRRTYRVILLHRSLTNICELWFSVLCLKV